MKKKVLDQIVYSWYSVGMLFNKKEQMQLSNIVLVASSEREAYKACLQDGVSAELILDGFDLILKTVIKTEIPVSFQDLIDHGYVIKDNS